MNMVDEMPVSDAFGVDADVFERAAEVFGLLSTPVRLQIVDALCRREMSVGELLLRIPVAQPNLSQHLGLLYRAGLLARRRDGPQIFYRIDARFAPMICAAVQSLVGPGDRAPETP